MQMSKKAADFAADAKTTAQREALKTSQTGFTTFFRTGL